MEPGLRHRFKYAGGEMGAESDIRPVRDWNDKLVARQEEAEAPGVTGASLHFNDADADKLGWVEPGAEGTVLTSNGVAQLPSYQPVAGGVKAAVRRLTNAELLALGTTPVEIVAAPEAGKGLLFMMGRVKSHIVVPYAGLSSALAYLSVRRAGSDYDESSYIVNDPTGDPDNPTYLNSLLTDDEEFGLIPGSFVVNASFQMLHGLWMGGDDFTRALNIGLTNGFPSTDLTGGDAANYLDVMVLYADFTLPGV